MNVDIILPLYNPSNLVFNSIDSVVSQTYTNWKLYIIDDASVDNIIPSLKRQYAQFNNKIEYFEFSNNKRAAACRNYAVRKGTGDFIAFIDQDDIWLPNKLKHQIEYIDKYEVDAVHGNIQMINDANEIILNEKWESENKTRREIDWLNISNLELAKKIFIRPNIRIISSMVKRTVFVKIGGFKEQFFGGEDELFWFEIAMKGKIGFINEILFLRREHENNTVKTFNKQRLKGYLKTLEYVKNNYGGVVDTHYKYKRYTLLKGLVQYYFNDRNVLKSLEYITRLFFHDPIKLISDALRWIQQKK